MNDRELVRRLMFEFELTQTQLAELLGVDQSAISRVMNRRQDLRPATRRLAERMLEQVEEIEKEIDEEDF